MGRVRPRVQADELFFAQSRMNAMPFQSWHMPAYSLMVTSYDCNYNVTQPVLVRILHGIAHNYN
jgi:hypothetical protein